jgi:hypothetical protein
MRESLSVYLLSLAFSLICFQANPIFADIPPPNGYHQVQRCATISNVDDYPDFVFVGAIDAASRPGLPYEGLYEITEATCLHNGNGYKLDHLYVFAVSRAYLDDVSWENVDFDDTSVVAPANPEIRIRGPVVRDENPLDGEHLEYSVLCINTDLVLCLTRVVSYDQYLAVLDVVEDANCSEVADACDETCDRALAGDATADGVVGWADYVVWADHFGATDADHQDGDFNCDGSVDGADYTIWADNIGAGMESGGGGGSGGEPAADLPACGLGFELLAVVAVLLGLPGRRR